MKTFQISFAVALFCFFAFISLPTHAEITASPSLFTASDNCPTASYSVVNSIQSTGIPIQFVNESTIGLSYRWDFGDGSTSTAVNPAHVYTAPGNYTVKLTVIGDACTVEFIGTEDVIIG